MRSSRNGGWENVQENRNALRDKPVSLNKFARRGCFRCFAGIHAPATNSQDTAARRGDTADEQIRPSGRTGRTQRTWMGG